MMKKKLTQTKSKRSIPTIFYNTKTLEDPKRISEQSHIIDFVFKNLVVAVAEGVKNNKKTVPLFRIMATDSYLLLDRKEWKPCLEKAIVYFSDKEEYEACNAIKKLITAFK